MLRQATDSLVIKPRLSATARVWLVAGAIVIVAAAAAAGYWGGRAALSDSLARRQAEIEALERRLQAAGERSQSLAADLKAARAAQDSGDAADFEAMEARFERQRRALAQRLETVRSSLEGELQDARRRLAATRELLEQARSSLSKVTRQIQIDQTAYQALREELEASNSQITELASELKFYRSIISPADGRSGVRIQEFRVRPEDGDGNLFRYRLVLIQALDHESRVKGRVRFEVSGAADGGRQVLRVPGDGQKPITAEFKYFQNLVGTFELPRAFIPAEVAVIFESEDEAVVERTYPWPGPSSGSDA